MNKIYHSNQQKKHLKNQINMIIRQVETNVIVNSLQSGNKIQKVAQCRLIVDTSGDDWTVTIYDDYIE